MKLKRKETEVFSVSFLDCICCGFGAVLLLFVITASRKADTILTIQAKIDEIIGQMQDEIADKSYTLNTLKRSLSTEIQRNREAEIIIENKKKQHTILDEKLQLLLAQLVSMEETLGKLMEDKKHIPKQEEKPPIPIPNEIKRQYLTGFDLFGENVLFLVEASGGMTDDNTAEALARIGGKDEDKRNAPKWKRVKGGLRWLIANMKPTGRYKIVFFNEDVTPLVTEFGLDWFDPSDRDMTLRILGEIDKVTPDKGANLEKAFAWISDMPVEPDRLVLITDGLPTLADSYEFSGSSTDNDRINMFRVAKKALTLGCPTNVLLYPMKDDPGAAVHYWRLTNELGGAMVCPSKSWPDV